MFTIIPQAVVFDIDGVLSNSSERDYLLPDWEAYFKSCEIDTPTPLRYLPAIYSQFLHKRVYLVTSRPETVREQTNNWLNKHGLHFDELIMMPVPRVSTPGFKLNALRDIEAAGYHIDIIFEDDPKTILTFAERGYPVVGIWSGIYDMPKISKEMLLKREDKG